MNDLANLTFLRRHYMELTKIFFYEIQKGRSLQELSELKRQIDLTQAEIHRLENEFNLNQLNIKE